MRVGAAILLSLLGAQARTRVCADELEVISSSATYRTRMFQGKPFRRDAVIEVELRSTSTAAVSAIDLAVFLGASLQAVSETRPLTLPTSKYREFADGGLAFRAEVPTIIGPAATRKVQIVRKALPLDQDVYAIHVVPAACKTLVSVGDVVLEAPAVPSDGEPPGLLLVLIGIVGLVTVVMILRQLR